MFKRMKNAIPAPRTVTLTIEGVETFASPGDTVAAAMLVASFTHNRLMPLNAQPRGPYCMMGICFDCLVEIDGVPNQRACQTLVQEGMRVKIQANEGNLDL
jgi:predicted molibdopterin-dependent oxidoreductase YjgC